MNNHQKVVFFSVKQNREKLKRIQQIVSKNFNAKIPLLILTPHAEASEYVNQFIWSTPIHSFIPHSISTTISQDIICITHIAHLNPNKALRILNLTSNSISSNHFQKVYDFDDTSTEISQKKSQKKIEDYRKQNFAIISA